MKEKKKAKQNSNIARKRTKMLVNLSTAVIADTLLKVSGVLHAW